MRTLLEAAPPLSISLSCRAACSDRARRFLNVVVAAVGLVVALPVMLLVAIAVKATSRGPAIYRQPRVGVDRRRSLAFPAHGPIRRSDAGGRIFEIYKFRTMTVQAGAQQQVWASADDPRVTPLGRVLRKYRLDELPQLVNVLKGDMNIVGPRPEQPEIFRRLRDEVLGYPLRQRVLPGITGLAQVSGGYDQTLEDVRRKVSLDLRYVANRSVLQDLRIMARTFPVMLFKLGSL